MECVKLLLAAGADGKLCDVRGNDAFDSVDDAIKESAMRNIGSVEEEMEEMRKVLANEGLDESNLAKAASALDVVGVRRSLSITDGASDDDGENTDLSQMELNKVLLSSAENFGTLVEDGSVDKDMYSSLKDIIHSLLEAGANSNSFPMALNNPNPLGDAPLHLITSSICAAYSRAPDDELVAVESANDIVKDLLSHGAKVGTVTMSLLPAAAHRGNVKSVTFLTETAGVNPNFQGRQGMSGLTLASRGGKVDIVKLLLNFDNLDLDIEDDAGKKAIDYATSNGKDEIVGLLQDKASTK